MQIQKHKKPENRSTYMVQELAGKQVRLDFPDNESAYGTLAGANNGFFKIVGDDGSAMYYNISHVISIEEDDGSGSDDDDSDDQQPTF